MTEVVPAIGSGPRTPNPLRLGLPLDSNRWCDRFIFGSRGSIRFRKYVTIRLIRPICGTKWCSMLRLFSHIWYSLMLTTVDADGQPPQHKHTNIESLSLARLAAVHDDVQKLSALRRNIPLLPEPHNFR